MTCLGWRWVTARLPSVQWKPPSGSHSTCQKSPPWMGTVRSCWSFISLKFSMRICSSSMASIFFARGRSSGWMAVTLGWGTLASTWLSMSS